MGSARGYIRALSGVRQSFHPDPNRKPNVDNPLYILLDLGLVLHCRHQGCGCTGVTDKGFVFRFT